MADSFPVEIGRPRALTFEEANAFWNAKHHMYSLKWEVAIRAVPPHVAVFLFGGKPGAHHDFDLFKEHVQEYDPYLRDPSLKQNSI